MNLLLSKSIKKTTNLCTLLAFFTQAYEAIAQNPYEDAVYLSSLEMDNDSARKLDNKGFNIINRYLTPDPDRNLDAIVLDWNNLENPFLSVAQEAENALGGFGLLKQEATPASGVGGLNVTNIADGLAKFLVQRTKQELSITFFEKFKTVLNDSTKNNFKDLFPKTLQVFDVIDDEIYQFSNYLNTLREAFGHDLQHILERLEPFLETRKKILFEADQKNATALKIEYFEAALVLINAVRQGVHPAEAIEKITYQEYSVHNKTLLDVQDVVQLFSIFSNSLKSTDTDRYWIAPKSLEALLEPATFKIYMGLLHQLYGEEMVFGKPFKSYLALVQGKPRKIAKYRDYVRQLINDAEQVTLAIQNIKQKKSKGEKVDSYSGVFQATLGLIKQFDALENLNIDLDLNKAKFQKVFKVLEQSNTIYLDVNEGNYNSLILDLATLLTELLGNDGFLWKDDLIKYGTFIANVAQAENSDQVQAAIEAVALPVGSASIKKKSKKNIALNAFVGVSPGWEFNGETGDRDFAFGLSAPIGITHSWGHAFKDNKIRGSSSIFVSLIDLGAVTAFRFSDNKTEELPEVRLENIFAPGAYYVYGFPKAPISIGVGGQLGPQLRKISADLPTLDSKLSYSLKLFVAVDLPLLNFYTKSK